MRDGHEPNEAEEQRPCCVPIEPVHVISSPKDRREQEGYQNSGSSVKITGVTSQVSILLPAPSSRPSAFCHTVPDGETDHLVRRSRSSCHLLAFKHPSRPWCLDCFHPIPDSFIHREHWCSGRCLDIDYCTISPCSARSRPSRSMSCVTRRPTTFLTTKRMIKLATAS